LVWGKLSDTWARTPTNQEKANQTGQQTLADAEQIRNRVIFDARVLAYLAELHRDIESGSQRILRLVNHLHLTANRFGVTIFGEVLLVEVLLGEVARSREVEGMR